MRATTQRRAPDRPDDAATITALLERYPALATLTSDPRAGLRDGSRGVTVTLGFAVRGAVDDATGAALDASVHAHVGALVALARDEVDLVRVAVASDVDLSLVRITRDARSLSRAELDLLVALVVSRFGERLVQNAPLDEGDDEPVDDAIEHALEDLRHPRSTRGLLGYRDEMHVMVYVVDARTKRGARARR